MKTTRKLPIMNSILYEGATKDIQDKTGVRFYSYQVIDKIINININITRLCETKRFSTSGNSHNDGNKMNEVNSFIVSVD